MIYYNFINSTYSEWLNDSEEKSIAQLYVHNYETHGRVKSLKLKNLTQLTQSPFSNSYLSDSHSQACSTSQTHFVAMSIVY